MVQGEDCDCGRPTECQAVDKCCVARDDKLGTPGCTVRPGTQCRLYTPWGVGLRRKIGVDNLLSSAFFWEGKSRRTASYTKNKGRTADRRLRRGSKRFLASLFAKLTQISCPP